MQNGVGRAAHRDVQRHGILEGLEVGDAARQYAVVTVGVVTLAQLNDGAPGAQEQLLAVTVSGQHGAVAWQGQPECFGQAVHRIGGEHAGAGAAGRAGGALVFGDLFIGAVFIGGDHHGVDQIQAMAGQFGLAGFHWAAGHKHDWHVQAQGGHEHAGGDLVAVGNTDDRVSAVGVDHVLHRVGDDFARGQGIEHAVVTHGDTVVHGDGIEFLGDTAGAFNFTGDQLAHVLEVHVTGHKLGKGVGDGNDRLFEIFVFHAGRTPQRARASHIAAKGGCFRAVIGHGGDLVVCGYPPSISSWRRACSPWRQMAVRMSCNSCKPRSRNQCAVRVVSTNRVSSFMARAWASMCASN